MPSVLAAISGDMTIGIFYAFMAYKGQFLDKELEVNRASCGAEDHARRHRPPA